MDIIKFERLPLDGAYLIELNKIGDERGFFARFYCKKEYESLKLDTNLVQINNSFSEFKGTLRGIHYQASPKAETKIVRCIKGSFWDVIVDLRPDSSTFMQWYGITLSSDNRKMLYVPKGFGHAFITLEDKTEALYLVTEYYSPDNEKTIRWNDPSFSIEWPASPTIISEKDSNVPDFNLSKN